MRRRFRDSRLLPARVRDTLIYCVLRLDLRAYVGSLPSSPGYVGVYQITSLMALSSFGVSESAAMAYGTVLQVLTLSLFFSVGVWAYIGSRLHKLATLRL